jgi:hypothetical protein
MLCDSNGCGSVSGVSGWDDCTDDIGTDFSVTVLENNTESQMGGRGFCKTKTIQASDAADNPVISADDNCRQVIFVRQLSCGSLPATAPQPTTCGPRLVLNSWSAASELFSDCAPNVCRFTNLATFTETGFDFVRTTVAWATAGQEYSFNVLSGQKVYLLCNTHAAVSCSPVSGWDPCTDEVLGEVVDPTGSSLGGFGQGGSGLCKAKTFGADGIVTIPAQTGTIPGGQVTFVERDPPATGVPTTNAPTTNAPTAGVEAPTLESISLSYTSSGSAISITQSSGQSGFVSSVYAYGPMSLSTTAESASIDLEFTQTPPTSTVTITTGSTTEDASGNTAIYSSCTVCPSNTAIALELNKQTTILITVVNPLTGVP